MYHINDTKIYHMEKDTVMDVIKLLEIIFEEIKVTTCDAHVFWE